MAISQRMGNEKKRRVGIVVSSYHDFVTKRLRDGALAALSAGGITGDAVFLAFVPGAFEIPQAAGRLAATGQIDGVVGLGCLIRGETPHFDFIASAVAQGLTSASLQSGLPMAFGVLTTNSVEEALARAGEGVSNKGWEAAEAVMSMMKLFQQFPPLKELEPPA